MKVLYIVPYTPTPIRTRPYNLLRNLVKQGCKVTLATVWENKDEQQFLEHLAKTGIHVVSSSLSRPQIFRNLIGAFFRGVPLQSAYSWQPHLANEIASLICQDPADYDVIHIEHLRGAAYGLALMTDPSQTQPLPPIAWDSVDNITSLFEQAVERSQSGFGRWVTRFELPRTRCYETTLIGKFQRNLVSSPTDRVAFEKLREPDRFPLQIDVLTNGVDMEIFTPSLEPRLKDTIIFSGKLSYHANVTAARYLVEQVMPKIWSHRPQARIQLVGKDPHPSLLQLAKENPHIEVTGSVPEIHPYLQKASVAAATLTYGAGVQNKVLEAMACGTPVVTTTQAVSGLQAVPGQDLLTADEPEGLADHFLCLFEDPALRDRIGQNGRAYVHRRHQWSEITRQLVSIYEDILTTTNRLSVTG